jgi:hypothetical protein
VSWRSVAWGGVDEVGLWIISSASRLASVKNNDSVYLLTKTTRAVPSASCPVHVELSWKTPRQRATLWAIIMPPPNQALADPSLPLYSALSLSLSLLSLLLSPLWIAHQTLHVTIPSLCLASELYSPVSYLGNASSFIQNSSTLTRSSLGYRRQKLPSPIHPDSLLSCMSFLLSLPSPDSPDSHRVNSRITRSAPYPEVTLSRGPIPGLLTSD